MSSFSSFVASLPVSGPVAPLSVAGGSFRPAFVCLGSRVVPSAWFRPVVSGVVSSLSWDLARSAVVAVVGGHSFVCLASALGGVGSPDAVALVAALRVARRAGVPVSLLGAPGASGVVRPGYFCAVA